jgi:hypothetical protein
LDLWGMVVDSVQVNGTNAFFLKTSHSLWIYYNGASGDTILVTAKDGYKQIGIRKSGDRKKHWFRVHRLVASAFCNPPDNAGELDVDHIDRNIQNNHCSNLRWVTRTENNANRQKSAWATNTTTGELYITRYRNGFMVRISNSTVQHRSWHKTIGSAVQTRNAVASGAS